MRKRHQLYLPKIRGDATTGGGRPRARGPSEEDEVDRDGDAEQQRHDPDRWPGAALLALRSHRLGDKESREKEALKAAGQDVSVDHMADFGTDNYEQEFTLGIWRRWGEPDSEDVLAALDRAVEMGLADPGRLGVGGWSYGGMLTNHVITRTTRFKAAITGASATLYAANYGHDMYQRWWEGELGLPWEPASRPLWERLSRGELNA